MKGKPRPTKATVQLRTEEILRIRLDGAELWDVREYVKEKAAEAGSPWELAPDEKPLSDVQLWRYIAASDRLIAESCQASRKRLLRNHLAKRRNLYAKAISQGDVKAALSVLRDEAELLGIYAPRRSHRPPPTGSKRMAASLTRRELLRSSASCAAMASLPRPAQEATLRLAARNPTRMDRWWADPADLMRAAKLNPDPWQADLLRSTADRMLLLCSRQAGKSTAAAALALQAALMEPPALVLLLSPTLRQSGELFKDKVIRLYNALGRPVLPTQETALTLTLANGSRIVSLPGDEETIRGYSGVRLAIVDEASRVPDSLLIAARPMLAVSHGRLIAMSTPFGKRGWFHDAWEGPGDWRRTRITAEMCPRIAKDFLRAERQAMGDRAYRQEYLCSFEETVDAVFLHDDVRAACRDVPPPLFARRPA